MRLVTSPPLVRGIVRGLLVFYVLMAAADHRMGARQDPRSLRLHVGPEAGIAQGEARPGAILEAKL